MDGLDISEREVRGVTILDLTGRLVLDEPVAMFLERMDQLRRLGHRYILLNFDHVTYLDSAGVGAIASKYVSARKRDGDVKLLHLRPKSHTVLKTTKLLTVLESFESEEEAIESFLKTPDDDTHPIFT